jgi:hypothetical protein
MFHLSSEQMDEEPIEEVELMFAVDEAIEERRAEERAKNS